MEQYYTAQSAREATAKEINSKFGDLKNYRNEALKINEMRDRIEARISESIKKGYYGTYVSNLGEDACIGEPSLRLLKAEYELRGFDFNYILEQKKLYFFGKKHPSEFVTICW